MILFMFVAITLFLLGGISIFCIGAFGTVGLVLFGDLIVFVLLVRIIIKALKRRK